jgi:hypothetical protein
MIITFLVPLRVNEAACPTPPVDCGGPSVVQSHFKEEEPWSPPGREPDCQRNRCDHVRAAVANRVPAALAVPFVHASSSCSSWLGKDQPRILALTHKNIPPRIPCELMKTKRPGQPCGFSFVLWLVDGPASRTVTLAALRQALQTSTPARTREFVGR